MKKAALISILWTLPVICGSCDRSTQADADPAVERRAVWAPASTSPAVAPVGLIRGTVKFSGPAPVMKPITVTERCCQTQPPLTEEAILVNANGTLRNVFVYLEDAAETGDGATQSPKLLDQVHCRYVPHALGIEVGQTLQIRSSDPTMHNVHFNPEKNPSHNFAFTQAGQTVQTRFPTPEFVRMKCDVHPWMTAWVGVFANPYFSVTQDEGAFEIKNVPAGTYTLVAWHEQFGRQEQTVTVKEGDSPAIDAAFVFGGQTN